VLDAGPLDDFAEDKVYDQFRDQGVLLIRRGGEVFAFSPVCPHKGCKVRPQDDQSFLCKCHGSRFDPAGTVLNGPATRDLLRLQVKLSDSRRVLVRVRKPAPST
jgi:Rieske Fe-S protein